MTCLFLLRRRRSPNPTLFPYTTLFRSRPAPEAGYVHPASAPATPSHRSAHVAGIWQDRTMSRADLQKQPYDVAGMFDSIARRYDLMNDVAALGRVRGWRVERGDVRGVGGGA